MTRSTKRRRHIQNKVVRFALDLPGYFRVSRAGVPHILYRIGEREASICWFDKAKTWRVFFPAWVDAQKTWDCRDEAEVRSVLAKIPTDSNSCPYDCDKYGERCSISRGCEHWESGDCPGNAPISQGDELHVDPHPSGLDTFIPPR